MLDCLPLPADMASYSALQVLALAAIVTPNQDIAFMVAVTWTALNLLLSNLMVRYVDMKQQWLSQLRYLSAMGYAFSGLARGEFYGLVYQCSDGVFDSGMNELMRSLFPNTELLQSALFTKAVKNAGTDCVMDMDAVVDYFSLTMPVGLSILILIAYLIIMHVLCFFGLVSATKKEKR